MSKYHPLDVRHPANRALEKRNFLLDPPAPAADRRAPEAAPTEATAQPRTADASAPQSSAPQSSPPAAGASSARALSPWGEGRSAPPPAVTPSPETPPAATPRPEAAPRRRARPARLPWKLIVWAVIAFVILRNTELGLAIRRLVHGLLWDLGLM